MQIFCDLDGVKADFAKHYEFLFGHDCDSVDDDIMWANIHTIPTYWLDLPLMEDWNILWEYIKPHHPVFLTGCPSSGFELADVGKRQYVRKYSGDYHVITCLSKNKPIHMYSKGDILIDDLSKNIRRWEQAGGIGILHKNAVDTIAQLDAILKQRGAA